MHLQHRPQQIPTNRLPLSEITKHRRKQGMIMIEEKQKASEAELQKLSDIGIIRYWIENGYANKLTK